MFSESSLVTGRLQGATVAGFRLHQKGRIKDKGENMGRKGSRRQCSRNERNGHTQQGLRQERVSHHALPF